MTAWPISKLRRLSRSRISRQTPALLSAPALRHAGRAANIDRRRTSRSAPGRMIRLLHRASSRRPPGRAASGRIPMTVQPEVPSPAASQATPGGLHMVIGGERVDAADGQTFDVVNPATGKVIATAPMGGAEDVDRAVVAARKAYDEPGGWSSWSATKRGRALARYSALVKENLEELAQLESQ